MGVSKKLVTVAWSVTIEAELPDSATCESVNNCAKLEADLVNQAWLQVHRSNGIVTDVQDEPQDLNPQRCT